MKRLDMKVLGIEISIPAPDDIDTNLEVRQKFAEENKESIMLIAFANMLFNPSGKPEFKLEDVPAQQDPTPQQ